MEIKPLSKAEYIANCVSHILAADCCPAKSREREMDIAEAVVAAGKSGTNAGHEHLQEIAAQARKGRYAS